MQLLNVAIMSTAWLTAKMDLPCTSNICGEGGGISMCGFAQNVRVFYQSRLASAICIGGRIGSFHVLAYRIVLTNSGTFIVNYAV